jgi:hypothetical protein
VDDDPAMRLGQELDIMRSQPAVERLLLGDQAVLALGL